MIQPAPASSGLPVGCELDHVHVLLTRWLPPHARPYLQRPDFLQAAWQAILGGADLGLLRWAWRQGYPYVRELGEERVVGVELLFRYTGLLWVGTRHERHDLWCYADLSTAVQAAQSWDGVGEPAQWLRHPPSGRRRPNGDPARADVLPSKGPHVRPVMRVDQ
jgi:hypothetical protein